MYLTVLLLATASALLFGAGIGSTIVEINQLRQPMLEAALHTARAKQVQTMKAEVMARSAIQK
ncbi:hypothetical protein [Phenylobacterium sp.]|uniref:hypothetical protein n=1 Tax=Phenylobacterium sp. TaxID=1871053 RepID=UPI002DED8EA7|nr:hypothetical protein [Phenylobacterium sp.]